MSIDGAPPALPPIETWWPGIDIRAKHWILAHLDEGALPAPIVTEIAAEAGVTPVDDADWHLSATDIEYIETQGEFVD